MSRRDHKKAEDSKIVLPITPMLDMTFQLLFFFIVSFNPADLEGAVDMALPSDKDKAAHKKEDQRPDAKPDDKTPEFPSDLTVKVRTQNDGERDGEISAVSVANLEGKEETIPGRDPEKEILPALTAYLKGKKEGLTNKEGIKLQGDGRLKVASIVNVMDACNAAGFPNISFVQPEGLGVGR
ncbi:MAG: biopolymer transporter ExbD [Gemmataceae bacterium]|nr:biopolymer transporter ExbD [Gemmataceae bacterium]